MLAEGQLPEFPTGLRLRRAGGTGNTGNNNANDGSDNLQNNRARVQVAPRLPPTNPPGNEAQQQQHHHHQQQQPRRTSHVYCFVSAVLALLAIVTSAASPTANLASRNYNNGANKFPEGAGKDIDQATGMIDLTANPSATDAELVTTNPVPSSYMIDALDTDWWRHAMDLLFVKPAGHIPAWMIEGAEGHNRALTKKEQQQQQQQQLQNHQQQQHQPWWKLSWQVLSQKQDPSLSKQQEQQAATPAATWWQRWLDPSLLQAKPSTVTDLIDKVSTSTPRLLAIANLLLALTYQMHTAVADWFLGVGVYPPPGEWAMTGRERLGSFLVFKLLLISAVAEPNTLDLLILLSWYTLLSFLRSLAHLAAATTSHTTQSGQPPRTGVLQLLLVVLLCDFVAAAACVALFLPAGVGRVVLLTCDCALLAVEVLGHILKHGRQVLEDMHEHTIAEMEEQQLQIHTRQRRLEEREQRQQAENGNTADGGPSYNNSSEESEGNSSAHNQVMLPTDQAAIDEGWDNLDDLGVDENADDDDDDSITVHRNNQRLLMEDSRRLDSAMDALEVAHARRLAVLDTTIFVLQLVVHAITVGHFLHIWYLHGIQFTLIDGVLALHLHSALSAASKQIAGRRNLHRIAHNLDRMFPNASDFDLKKAHSAGDVCCICLGAMSVGSVKKVGCGHLYHTNCLREVIERAISMEAAKCPLCRASVVDGSHPGQNSNSNGDDQANRAAGDIDGNGANAGNGNNADGPRMARPNDGVNHRGERALFRFSTEGILPQWMPLPAFSFEVVRRPTRPEQPTLAPNNTNNAQAQGVLVPQRNNANIAPHNQNNNSQQSFLRRLLLLAGAVPMSPEEEARALAQLVDMFPQYDRADLLRELRDRGSAESVVESVLLGVFSGRVRGSAGGEATPATANNPGAAAEAEQQPGDAATTGTASIPDEGSQLSQNDGDMAPTIPAAPEWEARI